MITRPIRGQRVTYPKVQVSDELYRRIVRFARASHRSVRDVSTEMVQAALDKAGAPKL